MNSRSVDDIDRHILALLRANGRESISSIARKVGLSRSAMQERLSRLEDSGIIAGYTIRERRTGTRESGVRAYMFLYLKGPICERVAPMIERIAEVKKSQSLGGEIDMILYVEAINIGELNRVRTQIEGLHGVTKVVTAVILTDRFDRTH